MSVINVLKTIGRVIEKAVPIASLTLGTLAVLLMILFVTIAIVARDVFGGSTPFALEYAGYMVAGVAACGAAYTMSKDKHVRIDLITSRLPAKATERLITGGLIAGLVFEIIFAVEAVKLVKYSFYHNVTSFYITETPTAYPQLILAIGLILFAIQILIVVINRFRGIYIKPSVSDSKILDEGELPTPLI